MTDEFGTLTGGHLHHDLPREIESTPTRAAWTTPATATVGQLMTASFWNAQVRDNLNFLYSTVASRIVQSGSFSAAFTAGVTANVAVSFPVAFAGTPIVVSGVADRNMSGWAAQSITTTGFTANVSTSATGTFVGYYQAEGALTTL